MEIILNKKKGMLLPHAFSIFKKNSPKAFGPHCVCLSSIIFVNIGLGKACNYIEHSLKVLLRYWRLLSSKLSFTNGKPYNKQHIINDICRIYVTMDIGNVWKKIIG